MNSKAYGKLNYTLALLGAAAEGKFHGCIVNSFHQVTSSFPPKFTVTLNKDNETCHTVESAGSFCVTLLANDCPSSLVDLFGYKSGRAVNKFADADVKTDEAGNPYLTEHMVSRISCKVVDRMEIGNFILLVGEAAEAEILTSGAAVLTLQEYTNRGKGTPLKATVYRQMEGKGFRCTVCGYIHESETLPADFICPVCHATADKFVKIED